MYIMINGEWVINSLTPWVSPSGHHSICSLISHSPRPNNKKFPNKKSPPNEETDEM